jgi:hypothetical protein
MVFHALVSAGTKFGTNNYMFISDDVGTGANDYDLFMKGTSTSGRSRIQGPFLLDTGITNYSGLITAVGVHGMLGVPVQVGGDNKAAQVTALGPTSLFTVGSSNAAFSITASVNCTTTSAAATVTLAVGWTDTSNTAQTATLSPAINCTTLGTSSIGLLSTTFRAKSGTNITYQTTISNTPTYDLSVALDQLSSN